MEVDPRLALTVTRGVASAAFGMRTVYPLQSASKVAVSLRGSVGRVRIVQDCDFPLGGSSLAYFDLSEPALVSLDVQGAHFGLAMATRERCEDPNSELICSTTQEGRIKNLALEAGRYFSLFWTVRNV